MKLRAKTFGPDSKPISEISSQQSPIADLEHPFALIAINDAAVRALHTQAARVILAIASAECKRMFQIGDRRLLTADCAPGGR